MSLTIMTGLGTALAAALTMSVTRNLPLTGAVILGGVWAYPKVEEYEREQRTQQAFATPSTPLVTVPVNNAPVQESTSQSFVAVNNSFSPTIVYPAQNFAVPQTSPRAAHYDFEIDLPEPAEPVQPQPRLVETVTNISPLADRLKLIEKWLEDEGAIGLLSLIKATPLRVVGPQRSGKTTFVKALALLRQLYIPSHSVEAWSPDAEEWPESFKLHSTYSEMAHRMRHFCRRVDEGRKANQTTIMDEFGSYAPNGIPADLMLEAVQLSTMRAEKNGELVVFILHGATAQYLGDVKGLQTTLQTYKTIWLDRSEDKLGGGSPGKSFRITSGEQSQTIPRPAWFHPDFLLKAFPELTP